MRNRFGVLMRLGLGAVVAVSLSACAAKAPGKRPVAGPEAGEETPVPTVPPRTATPEPTPPPIATRPIGKQIKSKKGEAIGPIITYFGAARADGHTVEPKSVDADGTATYLTVGSGFMLVIEAKPGESGYEPARSIFNYIPDDPTKQPDLQIESSQPLGDGSPTVCDKRKPTIGGIPAVNPASFAPTQKVSDALNDFACRFETFNTSDESCTKLPTDDFAFVKKDTMTQFCMIVARAWNFPVGDTVLSVRVRDAEGNPGPVKRLRIRRPPDAPKAKPKPQNQPKK